MTTPKSDSAFADRRRTTHHGRAGSAWRRTTLRILGNCAASRSHSAHCRKPANECTPAQYAAGRSQGIGPRRAWRGRLLHDGRRPAARGGAATVAGVGKTMGEARPGRVRRGRSRAIRSGTLIDRHADAHRNVMPVRASRASRFFGASFHACSGRHLRFRSDAGGFVRRNHRMHGIRAASAGCRRRDTGADRCRDRAAAARNVPLADG